MRAPLVIALLAAVLLCASPANAKPLEVALTLTSSGPQVYESGHDPGWMPAAQVFFNQETNETILGPVRYGYPRHPVAVAYLSGGQPAEWVRPNQPWDIGAVVFMSSDGSEEVGTGIFLDAVEPWPTQTPNIRHLFTIAAR